MVQCERCECYYHFTCANVTTGTVHNKPFVCKTCVPPDKNSAARSMASSSSSRSLHAAKISLELQRMDDEMRLQDEIARQKMEQLERRKQYISRKYDLLCQQEEHEDRLSVSSRRSNRTTSNRLEDWVETQERTERTGLGIDGQMTDSADPVLQLSEENPVDQLNAKVTTTPLTKAKSPRELQGQSAGIVTTDDCESVDVSKRTSSVPAPIISPGIPPVSIQPMLELLETPVAAVGNLGTKIKARVLPSDYETWKTKSKPNVVVEHQRKDEEAHLKREQELVKKVK